MGSLNLEALGVRFNNILVSIRFGLAGGIGSTAVALWSFPDIMRKLLQKQLAVFSLNSHLYMDTQRLVRETKK